MEEFDHIWWRRHQLGPHCRGVLRRFYRENEVENYYGLSMGEQRTKELENKNKLEIFLSKSENYPKINKKIILAMFDHLPWEDFIINEFKK
jgi:hypothetical protein